MKVITVCKNVIAANNRRDWKEASPPIRISNSTSGRAIQRAFDIDILDDNGNVMAQIRTTRDGHPIVKCGAKVAIATKHPVRIKR